MNTPAISDAEPLCDPGHSIEDLARQFPDRILRLSLEPSSVRLPLLSRPVHAGIPSPAADYEQTPLNFHHYLVQDEPATFPMRVTNDAMIDAGIHPGDVLVVDRGRTPHHGNIVVAELDGGFVVREFRLSKDGERMALVARNHLTRYPAAIFEEGQELLVFGVVTGLARRLLGPQ